MKILSSLILLAVMLMVGAITAEEPTEFFQLICEPVEAVVPPGFASVVRAPNLSVVSIRVKPKYARLLLDGRPIGRAGDFDGDPGPLFLRPGRYRIEAVYGGYRTTVFEVDARSQCLFRIKHHMSRVKGTDKESRWAFPELKELTDDIYGPLVPPVPHAQPVLRPETRPELKLRPDLALEVGGAIDESEAGGRLSFDVDPDISAVYLNGAFVASVAELEGMELPLAVNAGEHFLEIIAPGYEGVQKKITLLPGQDLSIDFDLKKNIGQNATNDP